MTIKVKLQKSLYFIALPIILISQQVMAVDFHSMNIPISANSENAITLAVENGLSSGLVNNLAFGNVDAIGMSNPTGLVDGVRVIHTSGIMTDPSSSFGSGYNSGAFYIVGVSTGLSGLNLRVRITGGFSANVSVRQNAQTMSLWYTASNISWNNVSQPISIGATDIILAQTPQGTALTTERTDDTVVPLDIALKILPIDAVAPQNSTLVFTATSNGF